MNDKIPVRFIAARVGTEECTFAEVRAEVPPEMQDSAAFFRVLTAAVTAWVIQDSDGRYWYKHETSEDANIADLAQVLEGRPDDSQQALRRALTAHSIDDLQITLVCHDSDLASFSYDSFVVDSGDVEKAENEEDEA